jgi:hypothetical protein
MAESFVAVRPPTFSGKSDEDADAFIKSFDRFIRYKELTDNTKQLNLLAVLFRDAAADWFESLASEHTNNIDSLRAAFAARYQTPEVLKFKSAAELFTRKQSENESVDDYVLHMQKLGRLIAADENIVRYSIINGLKPYISVQVTQSRKSTIEDILNVARIAELTMPRVALMGEEQSGVGKQIASLTEDVRRLTAQVSRATTSRIQSRSPTPERGERRVHFTSPSSLPINEFNASSATFDRYARTAQRTGRSQHAHPNYQPSYSSFNQRGRFGGQPMPPNAVETGPCPRCARTHSKRGFCPAMDPSKSCHFCGKQFHFQAACFSAARQQQQQKY